MKQSWHWNPFKTEHVRGMKTSAVTIPGFLKVLISLRDPDELSDSLKRTGWHKCLETNKEGESVPRQRATRKERHAERQTGYDWAAAGNSYFQVPQIRIGGGLSYRGTMVHQIHKKNYKEEY